LSIVFETGYFWLISTLKGWVRTPLIQGEVECHLSIKILTLLE